MQAFVAQNYRAVRHYDFNSLFFLAWINAMSMKNVMSGFRVCGVYPFNREALALVLPEEQYTTLNPEALSQISGLKYISLYSPVQPQTIVDSFHFSLSPLKCNSTQSFHTELPHQLSLIPVTSRMTPYYNVVDSVPIQILLCMIPLWIAQCM